MAVFKKCCCWLDLRTGGMVLGVITTIFSLICIASSVVELIYLDEYAGEVKIESDDVNDYEFFISGESSQLPRWAVIAVLSALIFANIVQFITSIFLVIGAKKNRSDFILPYLVSNVIAILTMILYILSNIMTNTNSSKEIACAVIYLLIAGYLWLCVFSLYQWIQDTNRLRITT